MTPKPKRKAPAVKLTGPSFLELCEGKLIDCVPFKTLGRVLTKDLGLFSIRAVVVKRFHVA